ncbi:MULTISPECIES: hypothetical protein [Paenibacillus]|jgi:hypothetical protein|uniref:Uncharacterized protein n=1 Tax=Paenibacillus azoreducens TaxID=116718 RepID=A0A919YJN6_9BACL|nr:MULTISPECIES: hypothetical protein [Paenibacillus]MBE9917826.1 hypothetical protein [Paenibacillus donghaensis]GIO49890.1 hypothetical protein J34TS1_46550 [Paenibacillus azoreducens]
MSENHDIERQLSEMLTEGEMEEKQDRKDQERELISPRYEIRVQTELDPIVEETLKYRSMARELDDRYDRYLEKTKKEKPETKPAED